MKLHKIFPIAFILLLSACSIPLASEPKIGVDISGVNYSDQAITYAISDPNDSGSVGGEPLNPFTGGGIMCCFRLPEKWLPGIKVRVQIFDTYRDPVKDVIVDLPPYVDGKPGRIWAVHYLDGSVDVLSSDYGPPHAKWPGKVKGWPVPTIEYRRKRWALYLKDANDSLEAAQSLIKELREKPEERLTKSWEIQKQHRWKELSTFAGPSDPAYKEFLLKDFERFLRNAQKEVNDLMMRKP
jgi:hypothetical protein